MGAILLGALCFNESVGSQLASVKRCVLPQDSLGQFLFKHISKHNAQFDTRKHVAINGLHFTVFSEETFLLHSCL